VLIGGYEAMATKDMLGDVWGVNINRRENIVCNPDLQECAGCHIKGMCKACSACHMAIYCGAACQHADWDRHKVACKAERKLLKARAAAAAAATITDTDTATEEVAKEGKAR
jgi:hypothetical protein